MKRKADDNRIDRRKQYRRVFEKKQNEFISRARKDKDNLKILDVIQKAYKVDMERFCGTQSEFQRDIERFYENRGP
jgi:hypothetical protein